MPSLNVKPPHQLLLPASVLLLLSGCASKEEPVTPDQASNEAKATVNETYHTASVTENVLTLSSLPDFRLEVEGEFTYLGSTSFLLSDRSETDVFLFVVQKDSSIERFVKVQVESLIDDEANDYRVEGVETLSVGDAEYLVGYWCFDLAEHALEEPESDIGRTDKWLTANGLSRPGGFVGTRLGRVFAEGRSEVLVLYGETTKLTGIDCEDEATAEEHLPTIVGRSEAAFTLRE